MKTCTIPVGQTSIFGQKAWYDRPNILNVVRGNLFSYPVLCDSELYFKLITFGRSVTQNGARQIKVTNRIVFLIYFHRYSFVLKQYFVILCDLFQDVWAIVLFSLLDTTCSFLAQTVLFRNSRNGIFSQ